nr:MAG TPA: hypothetical protein [Caudoviricetes sp.]
MKAMENPLNHLLKASEVWIRMSRERLFSN